jgi:hypothetical protein
MTINYDNRMFRTVANTPNGEADDRTIVEYRQIDDIVWATFGGGRIRFGTLLAKMGPRGQLDMRYQQINQAGEIRTGTCRAVPEVLPDGRIRLHEQWEWTSGESSKGESVMEEIVQ